MKTTILIFLLFPLFTFAQNEKELRMSVGYFGETLAHPGVNLGIEYGVPVSTKEQMLVSLNVGGYVHPKNNTSLFIRGQWGQRFNLKSGLFFESFLGLGYLHQFTHGGDKFEVKPNGAVVKIPNSGRPMVMPSVALGIGWNFHKNEKFFPSFYLRPELFWKAPFNGYYLTHIAINAGIIVKLKSHEK